MSAKVELNIVAGAMKSEGIDPAVLRRVLEKLNQELAAQEDAGEEKPPAREMSQVERDWAASMRNADYAQGEAGYYDRLPRKYTLDGFMDGVAYERAEIAKMLPSTFCTVDAAGTALSAIRARVKGTK